MAILFTQYWDVVPETFDEYSGFVTQEYIPTLERLKIKLVGGYYVAVGEGPRIVAVAAVDEAEDLLQALASQEYRTISNRLLSIGLDLQQQGLGSHRPDPGRPLPDPDGCLEIQPELQYPQGKEEEHRRFVKEECLPGMEELKIPVTGGWRLASAAGPAPWPKVLGGILSKLPRPLIPPCSENWSGPSKMNTPQITAAGFWPPPDGLKCLI